MSREIGDFEMAARNRRAWEALYDAERRMREFKENDEIEGRDTFSEALEDSRVAFEELKTLGRHAKRHGRGR